MPLVIDVYTLESCGTCKKLVADLTEKGFQVFEHSVENESLMAMSEPLRSAVKCELEFRDGAVPLVYYNGKFLGEEEVGAILSGVQNG